MTREAILYRTKNTKAKTVMISNTVGITSTNVFKINDLYPHQVRKQASVRQFVDFYGQ